MDQQSYSTTSQVYRDAIPEEIYTMCSSLLTRHGRFDAIANQFLDGLFNMMSSWTGCYALPFDILYSVELFNATDVI